MDHACWICDRRRVGLRNLDQVTECEFAIVALPDTAGFLLGVLLLDDEADLPAFYAELLEQYRDTPFAPHSLCIVDEMLREQTRACVDLPVEPYEPDAALQFAWHRLLCALGHPGGLEIMMPGSDEGATRTLFLGWDTHDDLEDESNEELEDTASELIARFTGVANTLGWDLEDGYPTMLVIDDMKVGGPATRRDLEVATAVLDAFAQMAVLMRQPVSTLGQVQFPLRCDPSRKVKAAGLTNP